MIKINIIYDEKLTSIYGKYYFFSSRDYLSYKVSVFKNAASHSRNYSCFFKNAFNTISSYKLNLIKWSN